MALGLWFLFRASKQTPTRLFDTLFGISFVLNSSGDFVAPTSEVGGFVLEVLGVLFIVAAAVKLLSLSQPTPPAVKKD
jgi:hypothetical protein